MSDILTSVIVPVYANTDEDVELAWGFVRSVVHTTDERDVELIVVDNGGKRKLGDVHNAHITVRLQRNRGFAGGVNAGLRLASGRWLAIGSADIEVHDGWLEHMRRAVALHGGIATPAERGIVETPKQRGRRNGFFGPLWMMSREVPTLIGMLDEERFPLIYGDTAYAIEARAAGLPVYRVWEAEITQVARHHALGAMADENLQGEYDRLLEAYGFRFYGHWLESLCERCKEGSHGSCSDTRCGCHLQRCKDWRTQEIACDPS